MHRFAHLRAIWLLLTLGTFLTGFGAGASAQWLEDNRARVTTPPSFLASVVNYHPNGDPGGVIGNATLIDSEWALTNRHVFAKEGQLKDRKNWKVYVPACKAAYQIADVRLFSKDESWRDDLAVFRLAKPACSRAASARLRILSQGEIDDLYRDKDRIVITAIYSKRMAEASSYSGKIGSTELATLAARCTARGVPDGFLLEYNCATTRGTSGAPVVSSFPNGTFVIGVHSREGISGTTVGNLLTNNSVKWMKEQTKLGLFLYE